MDAKRMDTKEKEFYCNMYQKIEPDEKVVEQLLQIEVNSEMRRKRMIKKFRVAVACLACMCVLAGGTVYASQKGYFERIKGDSILGDILGTDNKKITEKVKEDMRVDETQVVSDGTYTFQLVSYYKEVTMGNILLEIMVTRNDGKTITKKEINDFDSANYLHISLYGDGEEHLSYGAQGGWRYDENDNLIFCFSGCIRLDEKTKKVENVKRLKIEQDIHTGEKDEVVDVKNIGTMSLVQNPVELDTVELDVSNNPEASKLVLSALGFQLTTTEDDITRKCGGTWIYKKDGTKSDIGVCGQDEYPLEDGKILYVVSFGKYFDLETIDYIEIGGVKYKMPKDLKQNEKDSEK